jgi:hypothetical protein
VTSKTSKQTLANSFTAREVHAVLEMYHVVLRGGDARQIAGSATVANVARKFQAMQIKHEAYVHDHSDRQ